MTEYKIDKGIPMPDNCGPRAGRFGAGRPPKYPWYDMEVGDSFFSRTISMPSSVNAKNRQGRSQFACKAWTERGKTGYRVWRVK